MWTATTDGFYSVATDRDDPTLRHVRTWDRGDCDRFLEWYAGWAQSLIALDIDLPDAAITTYEGSDYPWRVIVPEGAWAAYLAERAEDMDYDRFKPAVEAAQGRGRHDLYERVFFLLATLEHTDPQGRPRPYVAAPLEPNWRDDADPDWDDVDAWLERRP